MNVVVLPLALRRNWWSKLIRQMRYGPRSGAVLRLRIRRNVGRRERLQGGKR
jgi:hypothetical protein